MRETAQSRRPPHWQARSGTLLLRAGPSPFGISASLCSGRRPESVVDRSGPSVNLKQCRVSGHAIEGSHVKSGLS